MSRKHRFENIEIIDGPYWSIDGGSFTDGGGAHTLEEDFAEEILRLAEENKRLREAGDAVLRGFEAGVFVRDISGDDAADWLIRATPHLAALSRLVHLVRADHATLQNALPEKEG